MVETGLCNQLHYTHNYLLTMYDLVELLIRFFVCFCCDKVDILKQVDVDIVFHQNQGDMTGSDSRIRINLKLGQYCYRQKLMTLITASHNYKINQREIKREFQ